jgi:plasmid maintenance system antidote protein VapI
MTFDALRARLLARLRERIRNGEWTERSLARLAGVSQPHLHNCLKGSRVLSPEMADRLMSAAHLSVFDLFGLHEASEIKTRALDRDGSPLPDGILRQSGPPFRPN